MISDSDTPHKTQVELNIYRFDVFSKNLNLELCIFHANTFLPCNRCRRCEFRAFN